MGRKNKHDGVIRIMSLKPHLIGLENIALSSCASNLFKGNIIIRQPDNLFFDLTTKTLYNVEYKCNLNKSSRIHAVAQLYSCKAKLKNLFPDWHITNLFIYENYKMEIIK